MRLRPPGPDRATRRSRRLDLIVCRNVLIYLGPVLQKKLMNVFHYALKPTGFLMLGASETIGPHADLFALADKRHKLYTKKAIGATGSSMDVPRRAQYAGPPRPTRRQAGGRRPGAAASVLRRGQPHGAGPLLAARAWWWTRTCRSSSSAGRPARSWSPPPARRA